MYIYQCIYIDIDIFPTIKKDSAAINPDVTSLEHAAILRQIMRLSQLADQSDGRITDNCGRVLLQAMASKTLHTPQGY
jgi:hypothetical protein